MTVTPDANDFAIMSVGGNEALVGRAAFLANFLGATVGTLPDKNDFVLMSIGGYIRAVSQSAFNTNFVGGLTGTYPDINDFVLMSIGNRVQAVGYTEFLAGGWANSGPILNIVVSSVASSFNLPIQAVITAVGAPAGSYVEVYYPTTTTKPVGYAITPET